MKILLMGEYSNVHATLTEGLRKLGHEVTVLSNGDFWKNYPRDIDLVTMPSHSPAMILLSLSFSVPSQSFLSSGMALKQIQRFN